MISVTELIQKFSTCLGDILDIAQFSQEEKKSLTAHLVTSVFTKAFHEESISLPKEKDAYLADLIRTETDPYKLIKGFQEVFDVEQYQQTLIVKSQEVLSGLVENMNSVASEDIRMKFRGIEEDFKNFLELL